MALTADQVVRSFYEGYNDRDLDKTYEQYVSHDLINHAFGDAYDREGWLEVDKGLVAAFEDLHVEVLDQIVQGDRVATRFSMTGSQTGEFFGIAASGARATLTGTAFDRIENEKIAEHWSDSDLGGFMTQLTSVTA
jgi:predicted ester cyclase